MKLSERKCSNCGSTNILEKDGVYVCMNCRTFFDDENSFTTTHTNIIRDEAKIEKEKHKGKTELIETIGLLAFFIIIAITVLIGVIAREF